MNETKFTKSLRDYVEKRHGGSYKMGASMFLAKGFPDSIYFFSYLTFLLESKIHPNKASKIQKEQIKKINAWGGFAWEITKMPDGKIKLRDYKEPEEFFNTIEAVFSWIVYIIRERMENAEI